MSLQHKSRGISVDTFKRVREDDGDHYENPQLRRVHGNPVVLRSASPGCMSGTLGDVLMFSVNDGCRALKEEGSVEMQSTVEKAFISSKQCSGPVGGNFIEWQQILHDNGDVNVSQFCDSDRSRFLSLDRNQFVSSPPAVGPWDCSRVDGRLVNYLQSFGPARSGSSGCSADGQLGENRLSSDGQLLLKNVMRTGCDDVKVTGREEEDFVAATSPTSHTLVMGGNMICAAQQQLIAATRGPRVPPAACTHQVNRSPNQAIRNLFPEKSSKLSGGVLCEDDQAVDEHVRLPKKVRRQDYVDDGHLIADVGSNRLNHGGQFSKSFTTDHRSNSLASLIDCSSSYKVPSSFSSSVTVDNKTAFHSNITSTQSPVSVSNFQTSGPQQVLPLSNSSNESLALKSHPINYTNFSVDTNNMEGGRFQSDRLLSDRDLFMDGTSRQSGAASTLLSSGHYMQLGLLGQSGFLSKSQSSPDSGNIGPWTAGLINIPALNLESSPAAILSTRRSFQNPEQSDGTFENREGHRAHLMSESRKRLLIQKQLTATDVGSLGRIILPKKEAETHLPHLPDKEGIEMFLYDYEADRSWVMKYRFWPNNKSRMYLLENTGDFTKFHALQQGDWLHICREPGPRYVLRAKKTPPMRHITPSSQSVTEPSAAVGRPSSKDVGGPAAASAGMMIIMSPTIAGKSLPAASKEVAFGSTTTNNCGSSLQFSSDILSLPVTSAAGRESNNGSDLRPPHHLFAEGSGKLPHHPKVEVHQEQNPLKYMAEQMLEAQKQQQREMPSELDGNGLFNLEDFPRLIEADDEIMSYTLLHNAACDANQVRDEDHRSQAHCAGGRGGKGEGELRHGRSGQQDGDITING